MVSFDFIIIIILGGGSGVLLCGGVGRSPPPPNAPKAPEGVKSILGEVVGGRLPGGEVLEIEKMSEKPQIFKAKAEHISTKNSFGAELGPHGSIWGIIRPEMIAWLLGRLWKPSLGPKRQ